MSIVPSTSITLLAVLGADAQSTRWGEFAQRYVPLMRAYCHSRFPSLDADDLIQETLVTLVSVLPNYSYKPDEKGHFHNYLTGILRHKALAVLRKKNREQRLVQAFKADLQNLANVDEQEEEKFVNAAYELALRELLANPYIQSRTKQIFVQTSIDGIKPGVVAEAFGITRNSVDQMKSRMIAKLREIIQKLQATTPSMDQLSGDGRVD